MHSLLPLPRFFQCCSNSNIKTQVIDSPIIVKTRLSIYIRGWDRLTIFHSSTNITQNNTSLEELSLYENNHWWWWCNCVGKRTEGKFQNEIAPRGITHSIYSITNQGSGASDPTQRAAVRRWRVLRCNLPWLHLQVLSLLHFQYYCLQDQAS